MGMRYVEDPKVNERVVRVIEELKEEIVSRFHPKSIILTGSFGRGEATVIEENGKLKFLSDCEVILIPYKWIFSRKRLDELERSFYERTGLKVELWGFNATFYLCVPFMNRRMKPTIANYDLKYGSRVIYGRDYLKNIPDFKPGDIPLWEGIKLMLNRMAEAMEYFSSGSFSEEMIFWTDKVALACQDALLLSLGIYHSSFKMRNKLFIESFSAFRGVVSERFLDLTIEATERKLKGEMRDVDPAEHWLTVSESADRVFRYLLQKYRGITFEDYVDFHLKYLGDVASPLASIRNLCTYLRLSMLHGLSNPLPLRSLRSGACFPHPIYSIIPVAYFELCGKDTVAETSLMQCSKVLSSFGIDYELKSKRCIKEIVRVWKCIR